MNRAPKIKYIVLHVSAGHTSAEAVQAYFTRPTSQGGRGWITGGYNVIIEKDGTTKIMYPFERITNGVKGFNDECIHVALIGGVNEEKAKKGIYVSEDTRTDEQKKSTHLIIQKILRWLKENGKDISKDLTVLGHRDFSTDKNRNNIIESYERIKDCPCCDIIPEYHIIYGATNSKFVLPSNRAD